MSAEPVEEGPSRAVPWPVPALRAPDLYRRLAEALRELDGPAPCGEPDAGDGWLVERARSRTRADVDAVAAAVAEAIAGCERCPVLDACREYALAAREAHGVWGALDMAERPWRKGRQS